MRRLIVFTRYPEPGQCKTRLIPSLGAEGAAEMHRWLTLRALDNARLAAHASALSLQVWYAGGNESLLETWLGDDLELVRQPTGDLGQRMAYAFEAAFTEGAFSVAIMGSDVPELSHERIGYAFEAIGDHDLVLGPTEDGGYYLVALRHPVPSLFTNMPWGSSRVLQETLRRADQAGLSVEMLDKLHDIDRPEDIRFIRQMRTQMPSRP